MNNLQWWDDAYNDVYLGQSGVSSEVFVTRLNTHQNVSLGYASENHDGGRVDCLTTGYATYNQIRIKQRKGRTRIVGLAFTKEVDRPVRAMSLMHSDNVIADPGSPSDTRLQHNQTTILSATMSAIFDAFDPKVYDLQPVRADIDGQPLPLERRVGFIADEVKAAIAGEGWTNIIGSKPVKDDEYLTLDYSRLICVLWSTVEELRARVAALKG